MPPHCGGLSWLAGPASNDTARRVGSFQRDQRDETRAAQAPARLEAPTRLARDKAREVCFPLQ